MNQAPPSRLRHTLHPDGLVAMEEPCDFSSTYLSKIPDEVMFSFGANLPRHPPRSSTCQGTDKPRQNPKDNSSDFKACGGVIFRRINRGVCWSEGRWCHFRQFVSTRRSSRVVSATSSSESGSGSGSNRGGRGERRGEKSGFACFYPLRDHRGKNKNGTLCKKGHVRGMPQVVRAVHHQ